MEEELAKIRPPITTFLPALVWAVILTFIPIVILVAVRGGGLTDVMTAGGAVVAGVSPVVLVICIVAAMTYHVRVYSDGVSSYDPYGSWQQDFVAWNDMIEINRVSVLGVPYVKIGGQGDGILWIPSRVFDGASLTSAVQRIAPQSAMANWMRNPSQSQS